MELLLLVLSWLLLSHKTQGFSDLLLKYKDRVFQNRGRCYNKTRCKYLGLLLRFQKKSTMLQKEEIFLLEIAEKLSCKVARKSTPNTMYTLAAFSCL